MAETTLHAIILRRIDSGETDRRLTILSKELGKIDVVAKGARKAASRLAGSSDPLCVAQISIATGKRNAFITQAQPVSSFRGLRTDYDRLTLGLALCELYSAVLPWEAPVPEAFDLLMESLAHLDKHAKPIVAFAWAELKLLELSGFLPQFGSCVVTGSPIAEADPFLSPVAGGYVVSSEAGHYRDRFRSRAEVLIGLDKLSMLDAPPSNLRFAEEAVADLLPFWKHSAETTLPANDSAIASLRHAESGASEP